MSLNPLLEITVKLFVPFEKLRAVSVKSSLPPWKLVTEYMVFACTETIFFKSSLQCWNLHPRSFKELYLVALLSVVLKDLMETFSKAH